VPAFRKSRLVVIGGERWEWTLFFGFSACRFTACLGTQELTEASREPKNR